MAIALFAPVPEEHLVSGIEICKREKQVAFGSRAWEFFRRLDDLTGNAFCDCLIYASDSQQPNKSPTVTWRATYTGHVERRNGPHPDGMMYRPQSTLKYPNDNRGHWAVFWHVADLRRLPAAEWLKISTLRGYEKRKSYLANFIPEGPLLVELP